MCVYVNNKSFMCMSTCNVCANRLCSRTAPQQNFHRDTQPATKASCGRLTNKHPPQITFLWRLQAEHVHSDTLSITRNRLFGRINNTNIFISYSPFSGNCRNAYQLQECINIHIRCGILVEMHAHTCIYTCIIFAHFICWYIHVHTAYQYIYICRYL